MIANHVSGTANLLPLNIPFNLVGPFIFFVAGLGIEADGKRHGCGALQIRTPLSGLPTIRQLNVAVAQPSRSLLVLDHHRHRYKTREGELLDASVFGLQRRNFRRVQIAFRIHGQVVQRTELSRS